VHGRATRAEYWWFALLVLVVLVVGVAMDNLVGSRGWVTLLVSVLLVVPLTTVTIRRLHDQSKSGWLCLVVLMPVLGGPLLLALLCIASTTRPNQWGPVTTS
jgi:uncharacterized membrane protein YhaH (DUF805 family)